MSAKHKRGQAVEHSYVTPVEIEEGGRLYDLQRSLDYLILYIRKTAGKGCCGFLVFVGIFIPLSMVIMGICYYKECPGERNITRYLLVGGLTTLLHIIFRSLTKKFRSFLTLLGLFSMGWFIAGSVWIFSVYKKDREEIAEEHYCDQQLYLYAFWMTVVQYVLGTIVIVYLCILCYLSIEIE